MKKRAEQTGVKPAALLSQPKLQFLDLEFLTAFRELDAARSVGFSAPDPIPVSEVKAYCDLRGIVSSELRAKYLKLIRVLDRVYLKHWHENQPKDR